MAYGKLWILFSNTIRISARCYFNVEFIDCICDILAYFNDHCLKTWLRRGALKRLRGPRF